ncbi:MAG: hypothetical protein JNM72_05410 [Deltaproteobacteria bacterium]|nr:hypothetical protein [Deltaproteobacteria bacterium]
MRATALLFCAALAALLPACAPDTGSLGLCLPEGLQADPETGDEELRLRARFVAREARDSGCGGGLTLRDEDGVEHQFGVNLQRPDFSLLDWELPVAIGDTVEVLARRRGGWGQGAGLVVRDEAGALLAAFDEGTWGGALDEDDVAVEVRAGAEFDVVREECETRSLRALRFVGDGGPVELQPFDQAPIEVEGAALRAVAVQAERLGPGASCEVTDQSDIFAWALLPRG